MTDTYTILDTKGERRTIAQGITTDSPSGLPAKKNPLREMMCIVMCACKKLFEENKDMPKLATDGLQPEPTATLESEDAASQKPHKLQQNCVATLFQTLDESSGYKSWVKAEVSYDMNGYRAGFKNIGDKVPGRPQPLMSRSTPTKPLKWHWGVCNHVGRRYNPTLSQPTFTKGSSLRRPDIVVVRNPAFPPEESNIAMIYEMKFDEPPNEKQEQAYRLIVNGDKNRVQVLEVKDCSCGQRSERIREVSKEELMDWAAAMSAALAAAASHNNRRPPELQPADTSLGLQIVGGIAVGVLILASLPADVVVGISAFMAMMLGLTKTATQ